MAVVSLCLSGAVPGVALFGFCSSVTGIAVRTTQPVPFEVAVDKR